MLSDIIDRREGEATRPVLAASRGGEAPARTVGRAKRSGGAESGACEGRALQLHPTAWKRGLEPYVAVRGRAFGAAVVTNLRNQEERDTRRCSAPRRKRTLSTAKAVQTKWSTFLFSFSTSSALLRRRCRDYRLAVLAASVLG